MKKLLASFLCLSLLLCCVGCSMIADNPWVTDSERVLDSSVSDSSSTYDPSAFTGTLIDDSSTVDSSEEESSATENSEASESQTERPELHYGDESDLVLSVQNRLVEIGYDCPTGGFLDAKTYACIRAFQLHNEIQSADLYDDATREKLWSSHTGEDDLRLEPTPANTFAALPASMKSNVFLDALAYLGYDVDAQIASRTLFQENHYYHRLLLTGIWPENRGIASEVDYCRGNFDYYACYETNGSGLPDVAYMAQEGLVCASYVGYVFFNYLPNVLGVDVSAYPIPIYPASAPSYYATLVGGNDHGEYVTTWEDLGLCRTIDFTQDSQGHLYPAEPIPYGAVILYLDKRYTTVTNETGSDQISHIALYAGEHNGQSFVTQTSGCGACIGTVEGAYNIFGEDACRVYKIVVPNFVDELNE